MDQGLKERLIGAAVLVALGVWLIPWVLDGSPQPSAGRSTALQLPVPEEPMPMRSQTIRLGDQAEPPGSATTARDDAPAPSAARNTDSYDQEPSPVGAAAATQAEVLHEHAPPPAEQGAASTPAPNRTVALTLPELKPSEPKPSEPKSSEPKSTEPKLAEPKLAEPKLAEVKPANSKPAQVAAVTPPPLAAAASRPVASSAAKGSWLVQLGSFSEEDNARKLVQRVSTFGYKAEISNLRSRGRTLYRVRVGPHDSRERADAAAFALSAHGIIAQVVAAD